MMPHYPTATELDELRYSRALQTDDASHQFFHSPDTLDPGRIDLHPAHLKVWPDERVEGMPALWRRLTST